MFLLQHVRKVLFLLKNVYIIKKALILDLNMKINF